MPDPEAQSIYDELNRRGIFKADKEAQAIGHELRRRKIVIDPTQGGLVNPVTDTAKSWVGKTTYKWGGQSFEHGADCSGFTCRVYEAAGKKLPRTARDQYKVGTPVNSIAELKPGDQIFFKGTQKDLGPDEASHTGIYLGDGKFVHSSSERGGVVEDDLNRSYWKQKWLGAKRHITTPGGAQPVIDTAVREAVDNAKRKILTGKSASENLRRAAAELGMTPEQARASLAQSKLKNSIKAKLPEIFTIPPFSKLIDAKLSGADMNKVPLYSMADSKTMLDDLMGEGTYDQLQQMRGGPAELAKVIVSGLDPVGILAGAGIGRALMGAPRALQLGAAAAAAGNNLYQAKRLEDEGDKGAAAVQAGLGIGALLLPGILTKYQTKSAIKVMEKLQSGDTVYASPSAAARISKAIDHDALRNNRIELVMRNEGGRVAMEFRGIEDLYDKGYTSSNSTGRYMPPQNNKQKPILVEPEYSVKDRRSRPAQNVETTINEKTGEVILPKDINANPDRKIIRVGPQPSNKPLIEKPAGYAKPIGKVSAGMEKTIEKLNAGEKVSVSLAGSEKIKAAIDYEDLASKNLQLIEKRDGNVITLSIERARQPFDVPKKKSAQIAEPEFKVTDKRPVVKEEKTHEFNPNTGLIEPITKSGEMQASPSASAEPEKAYAFNPKTKVIEPKGLNDEKPEIIIASKPQERPDINIEKPKTAVISGKKVTTNPATQEPKQKPENIGATATTAETPNIPAAQQKPAQQKPAQQKPVAVEEPVTTATAQKPDAKQKIAEQKAAQPKKGEKTLDQALKDLPKTANVGVDPGPYLDVMKAWGKEVAAPNAKKFIEWVKSAKDSRLAEYIRNNDFLNPMNEEVMMSKIRKRASEIFTDEGIARLKSKVVMQDGTDHTANMLKSIRDASISAGMDRRQVDAVLTRMRVFVRGIERKIGRKLTEEETAQAFAVTSKNIVPEGKLTQFVNQEVLRRSDVNASAVMPGTPSESFLQRMTDVLDEVAARHPNPFESKESWEAFQRDVYGATEGKLEPNTPHNLIKYSRDANFAFKDLIADRLAKESAERIGTSEWNKPVRDLPNPKKPSPLAQTVDGKVIGTYDPETAVIELSKGEATPATVAEELYHHLHKILMDADPEASKILTKHYGSYDVKNNRHSLEQAAQEYLKYLETGKAPSDELKPVFSEVAGWMKNVWSGVTGANPPKEVVKLYEMLDKAGASDPFIAAKAKKLNSAYGSVLTQQTLATGAQNEKIQAVQPKEGTIDAVPDAAIEKEAAKKPASQEANDVTGVAKAITGRDPQEGLSVKQALKNGKQAVRLGMDPHSVAKRVLQTGQPMNDTELAAVGVRLREVANASNDILSRIQKANPEDIIGLRAELNNLDAEMETLLSASDLTLNKGFHKLGMAAQIALDKDFQLQSLPARAKAATYNNPSLAPADMDKKIEFFRQENARLKSQLENAKAAVANEIKGGFGTVVPAGLDKAKIKRAMQSDTQWLKTYFGRESGSLAPSAKPMSRNQGAVSYTIPSEEVEAMRRMRRLAKAIAIDKDTDDINVVLGEIKNIVGNVPDEQIYRHLSEPFNKYLLEADVNRIKASKYLQDIQRAADYKMKTPIQKGIYLAGEAFNATARTLQAGADLSAPFIQGKLAITKAPDVWIKSWGPMIKALKDPENAVRLMASIERDPMYSRAKAAGLDLTSMAGPMTAREEMFASNLVSAAESRLLSSDNPGSRALGQTLSIYGRSEAAYNAFMNNLRYGMFKKMAMLNPDDPDYLKDIAMAINTATGRGSSKFAKAVGGAQAAGKIFYAPRYTISQWEGAMLRPLTHATTTKGRIEAAKWYAATAAFYAGLTELAKMSGFDVQTDPRATDFGQMQLPNGYKVDLFGKFSKPYSIIAQLMAGKISTTNRYDPASSKKAMEITGQYFMNKLAPFPRIGADLTYGKLTQEKGGAFSARSIIRPNAADTAKEVGKSFLPIWVQSALQEDYLDKPAIAVPSITGIEFNKGKIAKRKAPLVVGAKKR